MFLNVALQAVSMHQQRYEQQRLALILESIIDYLWCMWFCSLPEHNIAAGSPPVSIATTPQSHSLSADTVEQKKEADLGEMNRSFYVYVLFTNVTGYKKTRHIGVDSTLIKSSLSLSLRLVACSALKLKVRRQEAACVLRYLHGSYGLKGLQLHSYMWVMTRAWQIMLA